MCADDRKKSIVLVFSYRRKSDKMGNAYPLSFTFKPNNRVLITVDKELTQKEFDQLIALSSQWFEGLKLEEIQRS